jgi:hypothetical protein
VLAVIRRLKMAVAVLAWLPASGCADPSPPEGRMVCDHPSDCPSGWICNLDDLRCYRPPADDDAGDDTEHAETSG